MSHDGTVRCLDIQKEAFVLAYVSDTELGDESFLDASFAEDSSSAYFARADGGVSLIDFRAKQRQSLVQCQDTRINSLQILPNDVLYLLTHNRQST